MKLRMKPKYNTSLGIYITGELNAKLRRIAKENNATLSEVIRQLLQFAIDELEKE